MSLMCLEEAMAPALPRVEVCDCDEGVMAVAMGVLCVCVCINPYCCM